MSELKEFDVIINDDYKTKCYMKMEAIKTLMMLALTIAVIYGLVHSIKTRQKNELETSNESLYIDGKRMCRGILHFNGRLYSFECEDGTTYRGLQNFVVR